MAIVMCGSAAMVAWYYWQAFLDEESPYSARWFAGWLVKGLVVPGVLWTLINAGLFWKFGPYMPDVGFAQATAKPWKSLLFSYAALGILVVASYWLAVSLAWALRVIVPKALLEHRAEFMFYARLWTIFLLPISIWIIVAVGWELAGFALAIWLLPLLQCAIPLTGKKESVRTYAAAIGKLKFGKGREAELEILRQLEGAEEDFNGWMLLAEVYATQFKDLNAADQTVRELCAQPNLNAGQVVSALHRMADWHLQIGENPPAARETLEVICKAYAGTHLAKMAQLRINQMPKSRQELLERRQTRTLRLPALQDSLEESAPAPEMDRTEAAALANELSAKLTKNPDDVPIRERLAGVFAERLGRYDLGVGQIELLLEMPGTEEKQPQWLSQLASWQLKMDRESQAGHRTLQTLIERYPQSPQAFAAQRRLKLIEMERKLRQTRMASPP